MQVCQTVLVYHFKDLIATKALFIFMRITLVKTITKCVTCIHWSRSPFIEPYRAAFLFNEAIDSFHNSNDWEANLTEDDIKEYWVQSGTLQILNSAACVILTGRTLNMWLSFVPCTTWWSPSLSQADPYTNVYQRGQSQVRLQWLCGRASCWD